MPIYEYQCNKCKHSFELFKSISGRLEALDQPCPSCNEEGGVEVMISATNFNYSGDMNGKSLKGKLDPLRGRLQEIHAANHGSKLDQASTITKL